MYAASSSNNYLRTKSSIDDNCKWNIAIDSTSGDATIKAQGSFTRNMLRYNSSSTIFSCYSSGQMAVQLFKEKSDQPEIKFSSSNLTTIDSNSTGKFEIEKNMILDTDEITWSSSNENVLVVTDDGEYVTDEVKENTNVTVKVVVKRDNAEIASASLEIVVLPIVKITNITISNGTEASLKVGDSLKLTASVEPSTANQNVVWSTDNDKVCSVDENGNVKALEEGNATIKATSVSDSSKAASISISVSYLSIKEARTKAPSVTVKGVVTSIDTAQNIVTIQDDTASILLYGLSSDKIKSLSVGKVIRVTGESSPYNGLAEITNILTIDVLGDGTLPTPIVLENTSSSDLKGLDSTIFAAEGKLKFASTFASANVTLTLTLNNGNTISIYVKKDVASAIASNWNAFIAKAGTIATVKFTLPLGWYNAPQLSMLPDMAKVESADVDAVDAFVTNFMHPEVEKTDVGTGKCSSEGWYLAAKEAYGKLSEDQQKMFNTLSGYKDMKARYNAWAAVAETESGLFSISSASNNNSMIAIVCMSLILVASLAGFAIYRKRKA